jgi:hypothetical protein
VPSLPKAKNKKKTPSLNIKHSTLYIQQTCPGGEMVDLPTGRQAQGLKIPHDIL